MFLIMSAGLNAATVRMVNVVKQSQSAGGVVINNKGEVLVVNQQGNSWSLPKGHIDEGESRMLAARREIYEESGITQLEFIKPLGNYQRYKLSLDGGDDTSDLKTISMFLFKTDQENLKPLDPKNPEARWIRKDRVAHLLTHTKDKQFFLSIIDKI